ncbi:MAG TPA: hypothetical protein VGK19_14585 [Capsulimonadaceae bacterium]|jgi:hypothetical protein
MQTGLRRLIGQVAFLGFALGIVILSGSTASALPKLDDYVMSPSIKKLVATGRTVAANQAELSKLGSDFGNAYRLKEGNYTFIAPDYLEYSTQVGPTKVSLITTNEYKLVKVRAGIVRKDVKDDISDDTTKRQTLFSLGLLPENFVETVLSNYVGRETVQGIDCVVFDLRYKKEGPDVKRHFLIWVDPVKKYVVQKKVWDLNGRTRETIVYSRPVDVDGRVWVPGRAEAFNQESKLGGVVEYSSISTQ